MFGEYMFLFAPQQVGISYKVKKKSSKYKYLLDSNETRGSRTPDNLIKSQVLYQLS